MRWEVPEERQDRKFCSFDPVVTGGLLAGGGSLLGGGLNFMGQSSQAKSMRQAMERYLQYIAGERGKFLGATGPVKARLQSFIPGYPNYNPEADPTIKNIYEDYGKGLADVSRVTARSGVTPGGAFAPGRQDRTARLLGENLAANRAKAIRDLQVSNERFAISALPTYEEGLPATPMASPDVFGAGVPPGLGSFLGPALAQAGLYGGLAVGSRPILEALSGYRNTMPYGYAQPGWSIDYPTAPYNIP